MGVELSGQLLALYDHINRELVETNLTKDAERAWRVENMLIDLRTALAEAFAQCRSVACAAGV